MPGEKMSATIDPLIMPSHYGPIDRTPLVVAPGLIYQLLSIEKIQLHHLQTLP